MGEGRERELEKTAYTDREAGRVRGGGRDRENKGEYVRTERDEVEDGRERESERGKEIEKERGVI